MGGATIPVPKSATPSEEAKALIAAIDTFADGGIVETAAQHAQRINDLRFVWDHTEAAWERAMARAQQGEALSIRKIAAVTEIGASTAADRVKRGREQLSRRGGRRRTASA